MNEQINPFFNHLNKIEHHNADINDHLDFQNFAEAYSRLMYQSFYIIDYNTQGFNYVSENSLFLCGHTREEVQKMGYDFYIRNVPKEDLEMLLKINNAGFSFFEKLPIEDRKEYSISYDFQLINENKRPILINHKLTPMVLNKEGKILKALCLVSLSTNQNSGNIYIQKHCNNIIWKYNVEGDFWKKDQKIKLTEREIEILELYFRGFKISEIAEKLFISENTVKFHRKKLFDKMGTNNITEALSYALDFKLI